jgi:hypothetical protein
MVHLVGTAIGAFGWNSISELYTPPLVLLGSYPVLDSARHGFANLRRYVGVGQADTGTGLLQGTHLKPIPISVSMDMGFTQVWVQVEVESPAGYP